MRPGWDDDLALGAGGWAELRVRSDERTTQRLGQRNVPGVAARQAAAQFPYALSERREGKQRQIEPQQIPICAGGLEARDFTGPFQSPEDVACFDQHQLRTDQRGIGDWSYPDSVDGSGLSPPAQR